MIVNHFNVTSEVDKNKLNQLIYTHYEGDSLNIMPSCQCMALTGEFNVGIICPTCHVAVMSVTERPLESVLWIGPPPEVDTLMNPQAWTMLSAGLTYNGFNILEWLCNPNLALPAAPHRVVRRLLSLIAAAEDPNPLTPFEQRPFRIERGINYFYAHFDQIMRLLFDNGIVKGKPEQREELRQFIFKNREAIFAQYLPIPSKLGFITEKTVTSTYADLTMLSAIEAIRTISATVNSPTQLSKKVLQARAVKAIMSLAEYHQTFMATALSTKSGWFRKHVFGSRLHFTFRAVISSLSDNHEYDELHLPWSMSVMAYKTHLTAKLIKRGYTPNEATQFLHEHTLRYNPLLDELFTELIQESPHRGLPVLLNRNPTLSRGSIQKLRVTKIKKDPQVNSIGLSVLCLTAPNADFDGKLCRP